MTDAFATLPGFLRPAPPAPSVPGRALPRSAATALIVVTFLLCTIHVTPFADLQSVSNIEVWDGGSLYTQVGYSLLFLAAAGAMWVVGLERLRPLVTPVNVLLTGWVLISTVLSQVPLTSARRLALTLVCVFLAAAILLVARSVHHLARTLALTALCVLVLSYLSVAVAPNYAMHTSFDLREPDLAGDWRGPFNHKNEAGVIMVLFVFIGLLAWNTGSRLLGLTVAVGAATFLFFTHSKTALTLLPLVVVQVTLARVLTGTLSRGLILLGPVVLLGLVSMGSFFFKPIQDTLGQYMTDTSFTGRTDIWEFTVENILKRPLTGWGYGGFWRTEETQYGSWGTQNWLAQTDQAHNSYLDILLFMGVPGLALTLAAFVWMPLRDLQNAEGGRDLDAASRFFVGLWLYGLSTSYFETILFEGNSAIFLFFMLGLFGLRYRTLAPSVMR